MKLRQSIQRWEYEGGALLPADCNVHFWRYRSTEPQKTVENDPPMRSVHTHAPILTVDAR